MKERTQLVAIGVVAILLLSAAALYFLTEKDPIEGIADDVEVSASQDDAAPPNADRPRRNDDSKKVDDRGAAPKESTSVVPEGSARAPRDPERPMVFGRALLPDGKSPAARATISSMVARKDPDPSTADQTTVGNDGRFAIDIGRCDAKVVLNFVTADAKWAKSVTLEKAFTTDENLGDVILDERGGIEILVVEQATGQPIAGAIASAKSDETVRSRPTDAEGKTLLRLHSGWSQPFDRFVVTSPGHRDKWVPATVDAASDRITVALERTTRVHFTAKTPAGTVPRVSVRVSSQGDFIGKTTQWSFGNTTWSMTSEGTTKTLELDIVDAAGVVLNDLVVDRTIKAELIDRFGGSIEKREFVLRSEEWHDEHFDVAVPARSLTVEVIDADEKPIVGASVARGPAGRLFPLGDHPLPTGDGLGTFQLVEIYGSPIDLTVSAPGYVTFHRRGIVLTEIANRVRFVLEKSVDVTIIVRGADGKPIDRIPVEGTAPGFRNTAVREAEGRYILSGAPRTNLTISAIFAQKSYSVITSGDAEVLITIPAHGTLRVAGDFRPESAPKGTVVVEPVDGAGTPLQRIVIPAAEQKFGNSVVIPNLLPARYLVRLEFVDPATGTVSTIGDPVEATVRADAEVRVDVAPN